MYDGLRAGSAAEDLEQVGVIVRTENGVGTRTVAPDRDDGAGVLLARRHCDWCAARAAVTGRAVGEAQRLAVLGQQVGRVAGRQTGTGRVLVHDLAGVRVVGRYVDQSPPVRPLVVQRHPDRVVERNRLADLAARVGGVVLLVDRRTLDLEEEALLVLQQIQRRRRHVRQARLVGRTLVLRAGSGRVALAQRGRRATPLQ